MKLVTRIHTGKLLGLARVFGAASPRFASRHPTRPAGLARLFTRCLVILSACAVQIATAHQSSLPVAREWATVGGDLGNTRYSPLSKITRSNVTRLSGAWMKLLDSATRTPPVIAGDLLYLSDATSIYAINPADGSTVWVYRPSSAAPARGGVALGEGRVFCGLSDGHIVALDRKTGQLVWTGFIGDAPPESVSPGLHPGAGATAPPSDPQVGSIVNAPVYIDGQVISGLTGNDLGLPIPGKIAALDAKTGKLSWSFSVIPPAGAPGSETWPDDGDALLHGGGGVWTTGAADSELGLVYYGTGNAVPWYGGETRPGDNLYTASVVALDVKSGQLRWHYQLVHHDMWDMDAGTPLVLFQTRMHGKIRRGLAAMRTDGYLFLLDRETGAPLMPIEERPVKQDIRVRTAATQPFPVDAEQFGAPCVDPSTAPSGFRLGCYFDPLYFDAPNTMLPFITARHAPMSFDPQTGYFYVMGTVGPWWTRRVENPYVVLASRAPGTREYGIYAAIDSRTHKIVWQKRSPWGLAVGSGALTTAGGLLFHVQGDGNLLASDARTGEILWQFQMGFLGVPGPAGIAGAVPPASYEFRGEQYIAVPIGKALWTFKLQGALPPHRPPSPPPHEFGFAGIVEQLPENGAGEIAVGALGSFQAGTARERYADEYVFSPVRASLKAGGSVKFTNYGVLEHTIVAVDGSWTTGEIRPTQSVTVTISKPGNYVFFDKQYPFSKGQLLVR
jgi:quinohemoprotein ethanol dehydrogenase